MSCTLRWKRCCAAQCMGPGLHLSHRAARNLRFPEPGGCVGNPPVAGGLAPRPRRSPSLAPREHQEGAWIRRRRAHPQLDVLHEALRLTWDLKQLTPLVSTRWPMQMTLL